MMDFIFKLLRTWQGGGALALASLGFLGLSWCAIRWYWVERERPLVLLRNRFDGITRWLLLHRRSPKTFPASLGLLVLGIGMHSLLPKHSFSDWAQKNGPLFLGLHAALVIIALMLWATWNREPKYVRSGEGRPDSQFGDVPGEWGETFVEEGKIYKDAGPTAEILVYRSTTRLARRIVGGGQHSRGNLTLLSLRWDILCRHVFLVGPQGSGKTESFYAPIMHSSLVPWVYQDSKAELPFKDEFPNRPVFGLDVRGHQTRSGVWNPMEEIRSAEDFDLLVDYIFPKNSRDPNAWVRDMARVIFGAMLRLKKWDSIQQMARTLRQMRLEPFLKMLEPIYLDTMKEPKSQVPVLQDLVATLSCWETVRVRAITEGKSTITLDEFIANGGYVMNCEDSDALKVPVRVFWAMLLGRLRNRPEGSSQLLLLLDEFGDCGRIEKIQKALALLRSKGVAIVAAIQNMGLLEDVYPHDWKAVLKGFGTRIWLARNLEDDLRLHLSQAIGKFTRRVPPANKNAKETEREADLMPLDAWGKWSEARVALGRLHGFTYWLPVRIPIPKTPLGPVVAGGDPWVDAEGEERAAAQAAMKAMVLPEWCLPEPVPPLGTDLDADSLAVPDDSTAEEEWL